jgi:hypothetical protein
MPHGLPHRIGPDANYTIPTGESGGNLWVDITSDRTYTIEPPPEYGVLWFRISMYPCGGTAVLTLNKPGGSFITSLQNNVAQQPFSADLHYDTINGWSVFDVRYYPG